MLLNHVQSSRHHKSHAQPSHQHQVPLFQVVATKHVNVLFFPNGSDDHDDRSVVVNIKVPVNFQETMLNLDIPPLGLQAEELQ